MSSSQQRNCSVKFQPVHALCWIWFKQALSEPMASTTLNCEWWKVEDFPLRDEKRQDGPYYRRLHSDAAPEVPASTMKGHAEQGRPWGWHQVACFQYQGLNWSELLPTHTLGGRRDASSCWAAAMYPWAWDQVPGSWLWGDTTASSCFMIVGGKLADGSTLSISQINRQKQKPYKRRISKLFTEKNLENPKKCTVYRIN